MTPLGGYRVAVGVAGAFAAAFATASAASCRNPTSPLQHHRVMIEDLAFAPARLSVHVGDTITWTNRDVVAHTVTGAEARWDSGLLAPGAMYTLVVHADSTTTYSCAYHPLMIGTLSVEE